MRARSPSLVVAIIAVLLASTGSAVATRLITSKDIKNGTIQRADLSSTVRLGLDRRGPRGALGPEGPTGRAGPQGSAGATGVTKAYFVSRGSTLDPLPLAFADAVGIGGLPAGRYLVEGRAVAVNFTAETFVRCQFSVGDKTFGDTVVYVANDRAEAATIGPFATFESTMPFDLSLRCKRDSDATAPYLEGIRLWATPVAELDVRSRP